MIRFALTRCVTAAAAMSVAACSFAPKYVRPPVDPPAGWRATSAPSSASMADLAPSWC
jgi:hypothetical protein